MFIAISLFALIVLLIIVVLGQPRFGKLPKGDRLERIKNSPNYKNGSFRNQEVTPELTEGATYFSVIKDYFFEHRERIAPVDKIPSIKTDLINIDVNKDILIWFGHSSYFIQVDKKRILVDPVFSGFASPFSFSTKAFKGADTYKTADMPEIDYLIISHDHWDHLDYHTVKQLQPKIKQVICGLGTGEHFEHWGYNKNIVIETDWNEQVVLDTNFSLTSVPARHFSGRALKRNQSLWTSYVLQTPTMKIFIGGDSGYDRHFIEIGKNFGIFDLVILENGQYDKSWKYIHSMPYEVLQAAKDLNAKRLLAVHNSKFAIANHCWDDPLSKITLLNKTANIPLITPRIGEPVNLQDNTQKFTEWWQNIH